MIRRFIAVTAATLLIACVFSGCKVGGDGSDTNEKTIVSLTTQPAQFAGKVPNCDFRNEMNVDSDGSNYYIITVKCSESEYKVYMKLVKQCGFIHNVYEDAVGRYEADNSGGMSAEVTYNFSTSELCAIYMKNN